MQLGLRPTAAGLAELMAAQIEGRQVVFSEMALGDALGAWYETTGLEIGLKNECWRGALTNIYPVAGHPNRREFEAIPAATGFTIREFSLISSTGICMGIGMHQVLELPTEATSQLLEVTIRGQLDFVDASVVAVQVDPLAVATREYVDDGLGLHAALMASEEQVGHTQLATAAETLAGLLNSKAVHPAGLKAAIDALYNQIMGGATPDVLDTIRELAAAFGDDPDVIADILLLLSQKADSTALLNHLASVDPHPATRGQRYFFGQI